MRVLVITGRFHRDLPSGSSKIAYDEAIELVRRGEDVWMVASGSSPSQPEYEVVDGIHLLRYALPRMSSWSPSRAWIHQQSAKELLKRRLPKVDAIHGHSELATQAAFDLYGHSVHSSYTIHSPATMELAIVWANSGFLRRVTAPFGLMMMNRIEAECLRKSHVITALSQYTIDCIRFIHGNDCASRIKLVPGWVDSSRFVPANDRDSLKAQLGWPADIPVLFTLRRLEWRMGLDRLLNACHLLHSQGFRFHLMIGGSGSMRARLEEQTALLELSGSVTFLGKIEDRDLPLAYAACDAFVLPTAQLECFGLIALEALSAGRPVLATPVGAIPEIIHQFDSSWLARSASPEDIAGLLAQYLSGKLPAHAPEQLHDQVQRDYNSEKVIGKLIEVTVDKQNSTLCR